MAARTYGAFAIGYYCGRGDAANLPLRGCSLSRKADGAFARQPVSLTA